MKINNLLNLFAILVTHTRKYKQNNLTVRFLFFQIVIEFIQNNPEARYEDLLNKVEVIHFK